MMSGGEMNTLDEGERSIHRWAYAFRHTDGSGQVRMPDARIRGVLFAVPARHQGRTATVESEQ